MNPIKFLKVDADDKDRRHYEYCEYKIILEAYDGATEMSGHYLICDALR